MAARLSIGAFEVCDQMALSIRARRLECSQSSITRALIENPIQKAIPKNWFGARCVRGLVAKKTPITGRVVAIPSRMATARVIHVRLGPG